MTPYSGTASGKEELNGGSGGTFVAIEFHNTTAAVAWVQVFGKASSEVTLGATVPLQSYALDANQIRSIELPAKGWILNGTGITIAGTTTRAGSTGAAVEYNILMD